MKLTPTVESILEGNHQLRVLKEKDYLGEIALLKNTKRTINVVANGVVEVNATTTAISLSFSLLKVS